MSEEKFNMHYVSTREEAKDLVSKFKSFWVSNCGCRESRGKCSRSRMDVCLMFRSDFPPTGSGFRELTRKDVDEILKEAKDKHLVSRPFRNEKNKAQTDGICFCCDDCCGYFLNPEEKCDKGKSIEKTDQEICNNCGDCAQVCYFKARQMNSEELRVDQDKCYGCGLCQDVCPLVCIEMVSRG